MKPATKNDTPFPKRLTKREKIEITYDQLLNEIRLKNEALEKNQNFLKAINDFSSGLLKTFQIDDVLWLITHNIIDKFGFEDCVVYMLNEETSSMKKVASHSANKPSNRAVQNELSIPIGVGIVGTVAKNGLPELISDTRKDARYIVDDAERLSELAVPIISDGEIIGVIDSEHSEVNFYTQEHLETLVAIANLSSAKIKNLIMVQKELDSRRILMTSEEINKTILNNALDAVISSSADGLITFWNTKAEAIFGWTAEEATGKRLSELIIPLELRERHEMGMKHYLKTGVGKVLNNRIEITALRRDLSLFPVELTITPVEVNGKISFSAFIRDITERRQDEQLLKQQNAELERINIELDRFVYSVTHDLKAPLANMQGLVSITKVESDREILLKYYGLMDSSIHQMQSFIDDLITYTKNANVEVKKENIDLRFLLTQIIGEHQFMENANKIKFNIDITGENEIMTDASRFRIVFNNLISNAIKYHDFSKKNPSVKIQSTTEAGKIFLTIEDNGLGMESSEANKIFDMFYRVSTNNSNVSGSGIGLYILKETLKKIEGNISVESTKGKGTIFTVTLPNS